MMPDVLRILDVNLNRAREALRVIEDYTRFGLDDAAATAAVKQCRHRLRQICEDLGPQALLGARDIVSDVGQSLRTADEARRESVEHVVRAAFARLSEATRALAEYGKLIAPSAAAAAENLRYAAYEIEQRVVLRGELRRRFREVRLYVLITEQLCRRPWLETAEAAIRGGAGCLQLREKSLRDAELLRRARQLRELTRQAEVLLAINDRPDIARLAGADIVHVGQEDLPVREVRRIAGAAMLVGKSTHSIEQFEAALAEEPDYLTMGPMFPTATKPQTYQPGPSVLSEVARRSPLPIGAIGGITPRSSPQIMAAGASCLCVCSAVISADDPESAARAILAQIAARSGC